MKTHICHTESWVVRIEREEGDDGWSDRCPVAGTRTRFLRPEKISFQLHRGEEEPRTILVLGSKFGQAGAAVSRWRAGNAPEWLTTIIEQARQAGGIGRDRTGGPA